VLAALGPGGLVSFGLTSDWRPDEHEVHRWCRLVTEAGMPADPSRLEIPVPGGAPPLSGAVVLHPGAALPSRRWPVPRWAAVARELRAHGRRVVVTGGPDERGLALEVARAGGVPEPDVLAGRTSPGQLALLVAASCLVVAPDTGVAHLATALGRPSVVLFGPTPPALWGPPPDRTQHRVLWAGRTGDNASPEPDPGLLAIRPADVLQAAAGLLGDGGFAPAQPIARRERATTASAWPRTAGSSVSVPRSKTACQSSSSEPGRRRPTTRTPPPACRRTWVLHATLLVTAACTTSGSPPSSSDSRSVVVRPAPLTRGSRSASSTTVSTGRCQATRSTSAQATTSRPGMSSPDDAATTGSPVTVSAQPDRRSPSGRATARTASGTCRRRGISLTRARVGAARPPAGRRVGHARR
jgi:hypothetical protein